MKKVFMPSMDELYIMQDMGANVYKYLVVKAIETLVVEGINYPNKGMLKSAYKYLREDQYIVSAICMMYPGEIKYSEIASNDVNLCLRLLKQENKDSSCQLDCLSNFAPTVIGNVNVLGEVIVRLEKELRDNPKYRFEYQENDLIKRIINRELTDDDLMMLRPVALKLLNIEPVYGISLSDWYFDRSGYERDEKVRTSIHYYADTYGIPRYVGEEFVRKDILTNQSTEVKRLIKCINRK